MYLYFISLALLYCAAFYVVLRLLDVKTQLTQRSLLLSVILIIAEIAASLAGGALGTGVFINTALAVAIFTIAIRKLLILKPWQVIVIPVVVSVAGHVLLAVGSMVVFRYGT